MNYKKYRLVVCLSKCTVVLSYLLVCVHEVQLFIYKYIRWVDGGTLWMNHDNNLKYIKVKKQTLLQKINIKEMQSNRWYFAFWNVFNFIKLLELIAMNVH